MHCHVRPKAGNTVDKRERERERGQGRTELGRSRVSEEPLTPTEPQATSNKEIKWQFQRTQQLQECLSYVPLPPLLAAFPHSVLLNTHSSPLTLRNVPQPAKHNELLHLRSRCSIKSVLPPARFTFSSPFTPCTHYSPSSSSIAHFPPVPRFIFHLVLYYFSFPAKSQD